MEIEKNNKKVSLGKMLFYDTRLQFHGHLVIIFPMFDEIISKLKNDETYILT